MRIQVQKKARTVEHKIKEDFAQLHHRIEERQRVLLQELQALTSHKLHKLRIKKQSLESVHSEMGRSCGMAEETLSNEIDDLEFMLAKCQVNECLESACKESQQQIQNTRVDGNDDDRFEYSSRFYDNHHQRTKKESGKIINTVQMQFDLVRMIQNHGMIVDSQGANALRSVENIQKGVKCGQVVDDLQAIVKDEKKKGGDLTDTKASPTSVERKTWRSLAVRVGNNVASWQWQEEGSYKVEINGSPIIKSVTGQSRDYSKVGLALVDFGSKGSANGQLQYPSGVAVNKKEGHFIVADQRNNRVQAFNSIGGFVHAFGSKGSSDGQFQDPWGVAVDKRGHIIVADQLNHRIQVFDSYGGFLHAFGSEGSSQGRLTKPWGVAVNNKEDHIIVADTANHRIQVFDSKGGFVHAFGSQGPSDGQFRSPVGVAVDDKKGHIIVSDFGNNRIQVFDNNGGFLYTFGSEGSSPGQFNKPMCVAVDKQDHIIVTDLHNHRVQVFDSMGGFVHAFGSKGSSNGQFRSPVGVAVGDDGFIIVTDQLNHHVHVF